MKILVNITTYKRPKELQSLVDQLKNYDVDIIIWDDDPQAERLENINHNTFPVHYGKKLLWQKFKQIFEVCQYKKYDYYFFLPDDVVLNNNFISEAINTWKSIDDDKKICLSLLVDQRIKKANWTGIDPIDKGNVILTQWNDLCFLCEKKFFQSFKLTEIELTRWQKNPLLGSGVGSQISWKLLDLGFNMYNIKNKIINHIGTDSKMNPEERKKNPLI